MERSTGVPPDFCSSAAPPLAWGAADFFFRAVKFGNLFVGVPLRLPQRVHDFAEIVVRQNVFDL